MKTAVFGRDSGEPGSPCGAPPSLTFTPPATLIPPTHHHSRTNTRGVSGSGQSGSGGGGSCDRGGQNASGAGGPRTSHSSRRTSRMHNVSALGFCKKPAPEHNKCSCKDNKDQVKSDGDQYKV
uniref:Uncharacterized protein n=1 Tax=Caenorhabditis tropicalis TaxID=1561998 RepID=A0A1I7UMQ0_9PELO